MPAISPFFNFSISGLKLIESPVRYSSTKPLNKCILFVKSIGMMHAVSPLYVDTTSPPRGNSSDLTPLQKLLYKNEYLCGIVGDIPWSEIGAITVELDRNRGNPKQPGRQGRGPKQIMIDIFQTATRSRSL